MVRILSCRTAGWPLAGGGCLVDVELLAAVGSSALVVVVPVVAHTSRTIRG